MLSPSARHSHCDFCAIRLYSFRARGHLFSPLRNYLHPKQTTSVSRTFGESFYTMQRHCPSSASGDAVHWIRARSACFRYSPESETFSVPASAVAYPASMPNPSMRHSHCAFCKIRSYSFWAKGLATESLLALSPTGTHGFPPDFSAFHERPAGTESSQRGAMRVTACEPSAPAPYPRRYSPFPSADRGCGRFLSSSFLFSPARGLLPARPLRRCFPLPSA